MSQDTSSPAYKWARAQEKKQAEALKELYALLRQHKPVMDAYYRALECGAIK